MAYAKKKDNNQAEIENELQELGFSVQSLHELGRGVPDLLLGKQGFNFIIEVKHDSAPLTDPEKTWHNAWKGQVRTAQSTSEILLAILTYTAIMQRRLGVLQDELRLLLDRQAKIDIQKRKEE